MKSPWRYFPEPYMDVASRGLVGKFRTHSAMKKAGMRPA
jgi:hypothetical protein